MVTGWLKYYRRLGKPGLHYLVFIDYKSLNHIFEIYNLILNTIQSLKKLQSSTDIVMSEEIDYFTMDNFLLFKFQLPQIGLTIEKIAFATENDPELKFIKKTLLDSINYGEYSIHDGCLLYRSRVLIPKILQRDVLKYLHVEHASFIQMITLSFTYRVYWPNIDVEIDKITNDCRHCINTKYAPSMIHVGLWKDPSKPWEKIHIDFAGPFMKRLFLLVVDEYSMWTEVFILKSLSASNTIEKLKLLFSKFGEPRVLVSNNVTPFTREELQTFLNSSGIEHLTCFPNKDESYQKVGRFVFTLKRALMELKGRVDSVQNKLNTMLFTWRRSQIIPTIKSPAQLFLGRELISNQDLLKPTVDKDATPSQLFHYGQKVAVLGRLNGYVLNVDSSDVTMLMSNGEKQIHSIDRVIPFPIFNIVLDIKTNLHIKTNPYIKTDPDIKTFPDIKTYPDIQTVPNTPVVLIRKSKRTIKPRERLNL